MIRVALLGYGLGGRFFHSPFIATTPGMRLSAIVTGDPQRQRDAASDHPGAVIFASADELFADPGVFDLVVISTPNRTHVPLAVRAIEVGRAVVVDKPVAATSADARAIAESAKRHDVVVSVYHSRRWDGDIQTLRRLLGDGALGNVQRFESRLERWRPHVGDRWRERPQPEEAGGMLFDLGSHVIDQALFLFGPVAGVYAELDRRRAGSQVDDDVFLALTHVSGVRSHLWVSALAAQNGPRLRVLGDRAAYVKDTPDVQEAALRRGEQPGGEDWGKEAPAQYGLLGVGDDVQRVPTDRGDYGAFYAGMVRAMRDHAPPPVDIEDAIAGLEIIEHALRQTSSAECSHHPHLDNSSI